MRADTQGSGFAAEQKALDYLLTRGLHVVERNFSTKLGEIDLIMSEFETLVFIEVRMRNNTHFGNGAESVTIHKQRKIIKTAKYYLQYRPATEYSSYRFDVVSIGASIDWIRNAFTLD